MRTSVEPVNGYLKGFFQINNIRYPFGKRANVHFDKAIFTYNASNLAVDRINSQLHKKTLVAQYLSKSCLCGIQNQGDSYE